MTLKKGQTFAKGYIYHFLAKSLLGTYGENALENFILPSALCLRIVCCFSLYLSLVN